MHGAQCRERVGIGSVDEQHRPGRQQPGAFQHLLRRLLGERGIVLHVSGIKLPVEKVLERAGALQPGPHLRMYRTDTETLVTFGRLEP